MELFLSNVHYSLMLFCGVCTESLKELLIIKLSEYFSLTDSVVLYSKSASLVHFVDDYRGGILEN